MREILSRLLQPGSVLDLVYAMRILLLRVPSRNTTAREYEQAERKRQEEERKQQQRQTAEDLRHAREVQSERQRDKSRQKEWEKQVQAEARANSAAAEKTRREEEADFTSGFRKGRYVESREARQAAKISEQRAFQEAEMIRLEEEHKRHVQVYSPPPAKFCPGRRNSPARSKQG